MSWSLLEHQKDSLRFAIEHNYCILALKQGLGKTLVALDLIHRSKLKALVVVPAYLIPNWEMEIKQFFPDKIVSAFYANKEIYELWDTDIAVTSYDLSTKNRALYEWAEIHIFDEGQYLKNIDAKRTNKVHEVVYEIQPKRMVILTGTPIQNAVYEFYSLMALCYYNPKFGEEPEFLNKFPTWTDFADYFSNRIDFQRYIPAQDKTVPVTKWEGVKNIPELKKYLKPIYIRKDDSHLNLPAIVEVPVLASNISKPEVWEAFNNYNKEHDSTRSDIKAQFALHSVQFTIDYARDLQEAHGQIVIYSDHIAAAEAIAKALQVTALTGNISTKRRKLIAQTFKSGHSKYLVATFGAFSTGETLIVSNNMIINDPPWVPGVLEQAYYRIKRIGQTKTCFIHLVWATIQAKKIYAVLEKKMETIKAVT